MTSIGELNLVTKLDWNSLGERDLVAEDVTYRDLITKCND